MKQEGMIRDERDAIKVKVQLKDWEQRFNLKYGRKPLKEDLTRYPKVALKYAEYEAFKEKSGKTSSSNAQLSRSAVHGSSASHFFGNSEYKSTAENFESSLDAEPEISPSNHVSPLLQTPKKKKPLNPSDKANIDEPLFKTPQKASKSQVKVAESPNPENIFLTPQKVSRTPSKSRDWIDEVIAPSPLGSTTREKVSLIPTSAVSPILKRKRPFVSGPSSKQDKLSKAKSSILQSIPSFFKNDLKSNSFLRRLSEPSLRSESNPDKKSPIDETECKAQEADRLMVQKMVQETQTTTTSSTTFRRHKSLYVARQSEQSDDVLDTASLFMKPRHLKNSPSRAEHDDLSKLIQPSGYASSRPFRRQASMPLFSFTEFESFLDDSDKAAFHDLIGNDSGASSDTSKVKVEGLYMPETTIEMTDATRPKVSSIPEAPEGTASPVNVNDVAPTVSDSPVRTRKGKKSSLKQQPVTDDDSASESTFNDQDDTEDTHDEEQPAEEVVVKKRKTSIRSNATKADAKAKPSKKSAQKPESSSKATASNNYRAFKLKPKKGGASRNAGASRGKNKFAKTPKLKSYNYARTEGTSAVAGYVEDQEEEVIDATITNPEAGTTLVVDFIHNAESAGSDNTFLYPALLTKAETCNHYVDLLQAFKRLTGFSEFRSGQKEVLSRIMARQSTLFVSPTGSGKSICYQLPAFISRYYPSSRHSIVLVVSPTISLMNDQLKSLPRYLRGACLSGFEQGDAKSYAKVIELLEKDQIDVLFISPEKLVSDSFESLIVQSKLPPVLLACIDEIHCMSEWSHNFRPSYLRVASTLKQLLSVQCIVGLTGTATKETIRSICNTIELDLDRDVIQAPMLRPNLKLSVSKVVTAEEKERDLVVLLRSDRFSPLSSIIVYTMFQAQADHIAQVLRIRGFDTDSYHAGKTTDQRTAIQSRFMRGTLRILVSTVAFGLGINKPDIASVIHYTIPKGLENYVQEIGRSGRDGRIAYCHLFLSSDDYIKHRSFAYGDGIDLSNIEALLMHLFASDKNSKDNYSKLVLFEVERLEKMFDMKESVLSTLLTYVSLDHPKALQLIGTLNAEIQIFFTKSKADMLIEDYPFISSVLEASKRSKYGYICRVELAAQHAKLPLDQLLAGLKELQNLKLIRIFGECKSFYVRVTRPWKTEKQVQQWAKETAIHLHERISNLEKQRVAKLDQMYALFHDTCGDLGDVMTASDEASHSDVIQSRISSYFEQDASGLGSSAKSPIADPDLQSRARLCKMQLEVSIKTFVKEHISQLKSGRAVARIFHGLSSPQYPYSEWARNRNWGTFAFYDFADLSRLADKALSFIRMKATKANTNTITTRGKMEESESE